MTSSLKGLNREGGSYVKKKDLFTAPLDQIHVEDGFNARDEDRPDVKEHIESIARSLMNGGTIPPLEVRVDENGRIVVVDGHCRRKGALLARERGAPIENLDLMQFKGDDADRVAKIGTSAQGLTLTPYELANVYKRLDGFGWDKKKIADRMGKSVDHVSNILLLAYAPTRLQVLVREGKVSPQVAIEKLKAHGDGAADILQRAVEEAERQGLPRVTRKSIGEKSFSRKVSTTITQHFRSFQSRLTFEQAEELESLAEATDDSLEGRKVEIDAVALAALIRAQREAVAAMGAPATEGAAEKHTRTLALDLH